MIRRPLVAVFLVFSIILSGLEVLKEHDLRSSVSAYSQAPKDKIPPKTKGCVYRADTDDETAGQQQALDSTRAKPISGECPDSTSVGEAYEGKAMPDEIQSFMERGTTCPKRGLKFCPRKEFVYLVRTAEGAGV
jgi:hypothetical protein